MRAARPPRHARAAVAAGDALAAAERALLTVADEHVRSAVPMRVQPGATVPVGDLVAQLGDDTARYAVLRRPRNPQGRLDLASWRRATPDNPAFAVRFAHARLLRAARHAAERRAAGAVGSGAAADLRRAAGLRRAADPNPAADPRPAADSQSAVALAEVSRLLAQYPVVLQRAADRRQPHRLTRYLESLAAAVTDLLRVVPAPFDVPPSGAEIAAAAQQATDVLRSGLAALGVSAPEQL